MNYVLLEYKLEKLLQTFVPFQGYRFVRMYDFSKENR